MWLKSIFMKVRMLLQNLLQPIVFTIAGASQKTAFSQQMQDCLISFFAALQNNLYANLQFMNIFDRPCIVLYCSMYILYTVVKYYGRITQA